MLDLDFGFALGFLLAGRKSCAGEAEQDWDLRRIRCLLFSLLSLFPYDDDDDVRRAVLWPVPKNLRCRTTISRRCS